MYSPPKYFSGLSETKKKQKLKEMKKFGKMSHKNPKAYTGFNTDKGIKTKPSSYTQKFYKLNPNAKSLKQKADFTKVPLKYIKASYNRGLAAWRTGHRPGATEQQWGYARVHSFLTCGKTYETTDSDLARTAKKTSKGARKWWSKTCKAQRGGSQIDLRQITITDPIIDAVKILDEKTGKYTDLTPYLRYKGTQGYALNRLNNINLRTIPIILKPIKKMGGNIDGTRKQLYEIIDGRHRVAFAILSGAKTIAAEIQSTNE